MGHCSALNCGARRGTLALGVVFAGALTAACGSNPPTQPPPPPALVVTCPARVEADSANGDPVEVTLGQPIASGGVAPINTMCSPPSGTLFGGGTTPVTCTATDSRGVSATCTTSVYVRLPPRLLGTKFMAFGDSITSGVYSDPVRAITVSQFAYPERLLPQLQARYRQQTITMANEGGPGEKAHEEGIARFRSTLVRHRPEIVLLMMGTNDLLVPLGVERAMEGLRTMVAEAKAPEFNARVVIATIPPQRSGGRRPAGIPEQVPLLNERIRAFAKAEGLVLADVYDAMKDDLPLLIGQDDLHPTPRGFEVIAEVFFKAIQEHLEQPQPALTAR